MSTTPDESLAKARRLVLAFFPQDRQPTPPEVQNAVNAVYGMLASQGEALDRDLLVKEIESLTAVFQERSSGLTDKEGHEPWLAEAKNDRAWDFWDRYRNYLEDVRNMPPVVVRRLDQSTDDVLGQLEDPHRPGPWRRTGLVIGQVQSGKTGQYIGLAAKAVDAGYRFVVILAGIHNDLRSQTQLRVDEGLLGFDTQHQNRTIEAKGRSRRLGAGAMPFAKPLEIASPTSSAEKGDFDRNTAKAVNFPLGSFPVVLVVKKHWKILEYVHKWVTDVHGTEDENGRKTVHDLPLFVIDDEADNASINTKKNPEADPTKTNEAIRTLVGAFDKSAYVGYTATPFANIYIDPKADHADLGADLFPESFIRSLPSPTNYLGPERVFGLRSPDADEPDQPPLPLTQDVDDAERWLPGNHKSGDWPSDDLPVSLRRAIASFVLSCAARKARGQAQVHNSMLVHVTRFTAVQGIVCDQVADHVRLLADMLQDRYGKRTELLEELQAIWEDDFVPTTEHFPAGDAERLTWPQVQKELRYALNKIQVKTVNGSSSDALEYFENRKRGLWVIAVGGQKLSRGLTLEGLTVSYYLRRSQSYDSLLQMGRWFGYRPGYEDLCRLYTTATLKAAYVEVTAATDELRREVEEMATVGLTPTEFGLKVRSSSLGLTVTSRNKMRKSTKVKLSYSGEGPETVIYDLRSRVVENNIETLGSLVQRLDATCPSDPASPGGNVVWTDVPAAAVSDFLARYETDPLARRARPRLIAEYIDQSVKVGGLTRWTVCLVGKASATPLEEFGGRKVGLVTRAPINSKPVEEGRYTIRRVVSPRDEQIGLDKDQRQAALEATQRLAAKKEKQNVPQVPSGEQLRLQRRPDQALLLIYPLKPKLEEQDSRHRPLVGFQVSFPRSEHESDTEYVVNDIWLQEDTYIGDSEEDE